jgi:hypothetical protein
MKLLSQSRLVLLFCLLGLILVALGQVFSSVVGLGVTAAGAVCLLLALGGLWGLRVRFQQMLDDLQARQTKP